MYDENQLMCYLASMSIVKQWLKMSLITEKDYTKIDTIIAERFGIPHRSIWRENNLIKCGSNGNMPATKGGILDGTHSQACSADETC